MSLFSHEARQFKFDVLREVARRNFEGKMSEQLEDELAYLLIPTRSASFRCCVYKEREIIPCNQNGVGSINSSTNPKQIVRVIEAACDGCTIHKICVTDNCRKCMAKSCMSSWSF